MTSSNGAQKKFSDLASTLNGAQGRESESDVLSAVRKRFASKAEREQSQENIEIPSPASFTGSAPTLKALTQLIANATEAYTAALFRVDPSTRSIELAAAQTLSRELIPGAKFSFGQGLVGWVAENKRRVAASPFEMDSTTLMYYSKDQELKSFIAIPIFGSDKALLGVLAVDSKKSYAFSQMVDKIIHDCATVAGQFFELAASVKTKVTPEVSKSKLDVILETLRKQKDEAALLSAASDLPQDFIIRDSLVVLSLAENGSGKGVFYSRATESVENNRLLEIVCRHKKLISAERSVQALRADELGRTFLSIPIRAFHREAGSLNLLSRPGDSFTVEQISSLEQISETLGRELERCRLSSLYSRQNLFSKDMSGSDWRSFEARANKALKTEKHSLVRFSLVDREKFELTHGVEALTQTFGLISQLLEQLRGTDGLLFELVGGESLLFCTTAEKGRIISRLSILLGKSESRTLSKEIIQQLPKLISYKAMDSSTTVHTLEQLRKRTLEDGTWEKLVTVSHQVRPLNDHGQYDRAKAAPYKPERARPEKKVSAQNTKKETQQDWNW